MNKEEYYKAWRDRFDGRKNIRLEELIYHYQKLSNDDRILYWAFLTKGAQEELEFVKFIYYHLVEFVLEALRVKK